VWLRSAAFVAGVVLFAGCASSPTIVDFGAVPSADSPRLPADDGVVVSEADAGVAPAIGTVLTDGDWSQVSAFVAVNAAADRATLINLFASWCVPCRAEMPLLIEASQQEETVVFLGVAHLDARADAERFVAELDVPFTTVLDLDGEVAWRIGARGLPFTVVFDRDGALVGRAFGEVTPSGLEQLLGLVR
jgi:cytochrome c biogenesis protein CcmG, thiol:disulfide interchange protein DsbE